MYEALVTLGYLSLVGLIAMGAAYGFVRLTNLFGKEVDDGQD